MAKLKLKHKDLVNPTFLRKLQDIQKEAGKQKLSAKLKGSVGAAE